MSGATPFTVVTEPDAGVVSLLKDLLERARRGEILSICGVSVMVGGEASRFYSPSVAERPIDALGMLRVLQMKIEQFVDVDPAEELWDPS